MTGSDALECPHGMRCGGCAFLGVPYPEQLAQKSALVAGALGRYPEQAELRVQPIGGAEPRVAYRARAKLVFGEGASLGLFARDSHDVVDIPECRVLAPALLRVAAAARTAVGGAKPALDGLDLRLVDAGVLVTLIARQGTAVPELRRLADALCQASSEVVGVAASFREAGAATLLGTRHVVLVGNDVEPHRIAPSGPYHLAAHGAFTQVHLGQAARAHQAIESALRACGARRVLELYAGSAALSLWLAQNGFAMTVVEAFAPALAHAERAAKEQQLTLRTVTGHAERVARDLSARAEPFDAVIVNPPRRGLSVSVRRSIAALSVATVLYMSCDPLTLTRDLEHLRELGFAAQKLWPFDMIPHSDAVECLVLARRAEIPAPRVVHEDTELIAVLKSGYEPMANELGISGSLLARVRRLPGWAEALPVSRLDGDCSGICLFARSNAALPALERALADGAETFVGLARGVTHKKGHIRRPLKDAGRKVDASTHYRREALHGGHSLLTIEPEARSVAQVRAHLASIGHPILGDRGSGDAASNSFFEHRHGLDRSFLHCTRVRLSLPSGSLTLEAPLPGELAGVLASASEQAAARR